jgi:hypothetical protein
LKSGYQQNDGKKCAHCIPTKESPPVWNKWG